MAALPPEFLSALAALFPADLASFDPSDLAEYGRDWTRVVRAGARRPSPSRGRRPRSRGW